MPKDALMAVQARNSFYKKCQRKVVAVLLLSLAMNILLASLWIYLLRHPPAPRFFATTINGRITPLFPLNQPNQSDESMLKWASLAAVAAFNYNFVNYREELQASSGFFTPEGWELFLNALGQSNNLDAVRAKKLIVSALPLTAAEILQRGVLNGRYSWQVRLQIQVTYQSNVEYTQQVNQVTMIIQRVSTLNSPKGIGISQFVVEPLG